MRIVDWMTQGEVPATDLAEGAWERGRRRRRRRVVTTTVAAVLAVAVSATTFVTLHHDDTRRSTVAPADPVTDESAPGADALLTAGGEPRLIMFAGIGGVVGLDDRGCVVLTAGRSHVAVWPTGWTATVADDEATIYRPDGSVFARSGDTVRGGGGYVPSDPVDTAWGPPVDRTSRCFPDGRATLVHLQSVGAATRTPVDREIGRGLPCPASEHVTTDVDYMGPGQPTPAQAVALSTGGQKVTEVVGREGLVHVLWSNGAVRRTYRVTEQSDGWWYDAYAECRS